jgi:hydrogenase maturation protease
VNLDRVEKIAEAVLYEGYMLYPYRPSSVKNQQRWNFGVLYPPGYCEQQGGLDPSSMQTECLLKADSSTRLTVKIRFLQIVQRAIGKLRGSASDVPANVEPALEFVDRLELSGRVYQPWQEAVERELSYEDLALESRTYSPQSFSFPAGRSIELLRDEQGQIAGAIVRTWNALTGSVEIGAKSCRDDVVKVKIRGENHTHSEGETSSDSARREAILLDSLISAHTILGVEKGEFISLLEPPADLEDLAAQCKNVGTWPVLAGDGADAMLSSPIILYDHPQIAPESAGNLFDATEIDEILSLRILTLTEDEKREMRQSDDRTRGILERTENMPEEQFMKLHGVLRGLTPSKEETR